MIQDLRNTVVPETVEVVEVIVRLAVSVYTDDLATSIHGHVDCRRATVVNGNMTVNTNA